MMLNGTKQLTIGSCFSVRTSSYGCTWEVWGAQEKRKSRSRMHADVLSV